MKEWERKRVKESECIRPILSWEIRFSWEGERKKERLHYFFFYLFQINCFNSLLILFLRTFLFRFFWIEFKSIASPFFLSPSLPLFLPSSFFRIRDWWTFFIQFSSIEFFSWSNNCSLFNVFLNIILLLFNSFLSSFSHSFPFLPVLDFSSPLPEFWFRWSFVWIWMNFLSLTNEWLSRRNRIHPFVSFLRRIRPSFLPLFCVSFLSLSSTLNPSLSLSSQLIQQTYLNQNLES